MKSSNLVMAIASAFITCKSNSQTMNSTNFIAEKVSKTASIILNTGVDNVFPLFRAFEERNWTHGWDPTLIYPATEVIEEGTTFKTPGHGDDENEFLWCVSKFENEKYLIQYLVSTPNRYWTITIKCKDAAHNRTSAEITYSFIGLNETGNKINKLALERMYKKKILRIGKKR